VRFNDSLSGFKSAWLRVKLKLQGSRKRLAAADLRLGQECEKVAIHQLPRGVTYLRK